MERPKNVKRKPLIILTAALISSIVLAIFSYQMTISTWIRTALVQPLPTPAKVTPIPTPSSNPSLNPSSVLGIDSGPPSLYPGISWTRISYPTCGPSPLLGEALRQSIQLDHSQGASVLLLLCQQPNQLFNIQPINDVAQSGADAVECGNEQMKHNTYATYVPPEKFARFFDLCERTVHAAHPDIPVLLGSLDPHVGGIDYQPLLDQVRYLDAMQNAMNTVVHPGGHWSWRSQILGLIDSWHNGFPGPSVNSLRALFIFWAQQFGIDLNSGALGQHVWVVEGTGCVYGCGLNSTYEISVAHILTLITDVQTAIHYHVPFFYFSGKDFFQHGQSAFWPMGVLDVSGNPKPLRQDLQLGARVLVLTCSTGQVRVADQEQLLAKLYTGCVPPDNYLNVLAS